ncbi:3260_t:CDS:10, partial [Acaulospora morrowiae]
AHMSLPISLSEKSSDLFSCLPFPLEIGLFSSCTGIFFIPIILLSYIVVFGLYRILRKQSGYTLLRENRPRATPLIKTIYGFTGFVLLSYLADCAVIIVRALESKVWASSTLVFYDVTSWAAWLINMTLMVVERNNTGRWSLANYLFYWISLTGETLVFFNWVIIVKDRKKAGSYVSNYDVTLFGILAVRYVALLIVSIASLIQALRLSLGDDAESGQGLLENSSSYGTFPSNENGNQPRETNIPEKGAFADFFEKMRRLIPFLWPKHKPWLQFLIFICFGLLVAGRVINVLVPMQIKVITDSLTGDNGNPPSFPWAAILIYVFLKFLQSGVGLLQAIQNYLWIPIGQYTTREISVKMFDHLHGLSLSYHINRKTGEVLRVMDRGTSSIISLLNQILFQIVPVIVDIIVAVVYFIVMFGWEFGIIVFFTMSSYIFVTVVITEWRTKFRREMIELDNNTRAKAVDSLLNFETVKYYNAEQFEVRRYDESIKKFQVAEYKVNSSLNLLNLSQNLVITLGLLSGCLVCAREVTKGVFTVGDFILFVTYINQLYTPLNFFGTYYRMIQQNFIDMEKMLDLFKEQQSVQDIPGAPELKVTEGSVIFENVGFSYDPRNTALKNISFTIPRGKTVALVGPSGGGKSTILRLLFRFYDVSSGRILIDGQDIRLVKQESLRRNIGVVPQDTVLFNDTVLYNIHYGNVHAAEKDVYEAAKAAQIHDRVNSFPDGYNTLVGERGLRLSGGEKQRVAIARTILKNPPIILLDEATSALDTTTERQIQHALSHMTQDRTTLVIAHRLSTIVNADLILCIKDGQVVEQGTHDELVQQAIKRGGEGVYYEMWQKQLRDETEGRNVGVDGDSNDESNGDANKTGETSHQPPSTHHH